MIRGTRVRLALTAALLGVVGCDVGLLSPHTRAALVPPTADEDPLLPRLRVTVAGHDRQLHLRRFGEPDSPVALVLPGGPGADFRLLLPLQALTERYHVVMWDPRGAGLSERVTEAELGLDTFGEEIEAVRQAVAGGRPVTLIGHSLGAGVMLRYTARNPQAVEQLVLLEPGPLTPEGARDYDGGRISFRHGQDFFWQNHILSSSDHEAADYKAVSLLPEALRTFTCSGEPPAENPMWRFGAYQYHVVLHRIRSRRDSLDWTEGIEDFDGEILVIAGTCGAASAGFQERYNLGTLPGAELAAIAGAGHLSLFTRHAAETLAVLRDRLRAYRSNGEGS